MRLRGTVVALLVLSGGASCQSEPEAVSLLPGVTEPGDLGRVVALGFAFAEGPTYGPDGELLFSDIPTDRVVQLAPDGALTDFMKPSHSANGLAFDRRGRLYICQERKRRIVALGPDADEPEVIAARYGGRALNSPNDLAFDGEGGLYFTDPRYDRVSVVGAPPEQDAMGVYYVSRARDLTRVIDDLVLPNGIAVSTDGDWLYVAEPEKRLIYRYAIERPGVVGARTVFYEGHPTEDGWGPDGICLDKRGRMFATYEKLVVLDEEGEFLGRLNVPQRPTNCTFGGPDRKTLYITTASAVLAVRTVVPGPRLVRGP